ncbi:MAG: hypothetical protein AAF378_02195 [Cyanobacteria bacterium P01_A01_bin.84]
MKKVKKPIEEMSLEELKTEVASLREDFEKLGDAWNEEIPKLKHIVWLLEKAVLKK